MSYKIIAKFFVFVIFAAITSVFLSGCGLAASDADLSAPDSAYMSPKVSGSIKSAAITESSGIAASRCQNNVLWTHNDSGDEAFIYALNSTGKSLGTWKVTNAQNIDWEDIAAFKDKTGKCFIFIGEIGDNERIRVDHAVYRVPEPIVTEADAESTRKDPRLTSDAEMLKFRYPDYNQDAETLMVRPDTGDIYIVTKRITGPAGVYRIKSDFNKSESQIAEFITDIAVPAVPNGFLTGGDISPDGRHVIICDYTQAYEFALPTENSNFDKIWNQMPVVVNLGRRKTGESVGYNVDGTAIYATSEGRNSPVIEVKRRK